MENWLQWSITTIVGILGILAGRVWERYDRKLKKDKEIIDTILDIMPIDSGILNLLRTHDFGGWFRIDLLDSLYKLSFFLDQPSNYLLNKNLNKKMTKLRQAIDDFKILVAYETFPLDNNQKFQGIARPEEFILRTITHPKSIGEPINEDELEKLRKESEDRFYKTKKELNSKASEVCQNFDELIKTARKIL